jgi:hypothetical protein
MIYWQGLSESFIQISTKLHITTWKKKIYNERNLWLLNKGVGGLWCLTPLSTIFPLHHGSQFYWWRKQEYAEKTTDLHLLYYFPHILAEYNTWINNLHIFILRIAPKKCGLQGYPAPKFVFGSSWWTINSYSIHSFNLTIHGKITCCCGIRRGGKSFYYIISKCSPVEII